MKVVPFVGGIRAKTSHQLVLRTLGIMHIISRMAPVVGQVCLTAGVQLVIGEKRKYFLKIVSKDDFAFLSLPLPAAQRWRS